jgi:hypothetical protein
MNEADTRAEHMDPALAASGLALHAAEPPVLRLIPVLLKPRRGHQPGGQLGTDHFHQCGRRRRRAAREHAAEVAQNLHRRGK